MRESMDPYYPAQAPRATSLAEATVGLAQFVSSVRCGLRSSALRLVVWFYGVGHERRVHRMAAEIR